MGIVGDSRVEALEWARNPRNGIQNLVVGRASGMVERRLH